MDDNSRIEDIRKRIENGALISDDEKQFLVRVIQKKLNAIPQKRIVSLPDASGQKVDIGGVENAASTLPDPVVGRILGKIISMKQSRECVIEKLKRILDDA